jgi:hypothetical protein
MFLWWIFIGIFVVAYFLSMRKKEQTDWRAGRLGILAGFVFIAWVVWTLLAKLI